MNCSKLVKILAAAASLALLPMQADAQAWPTRTIRIVVPSGPGGAIDVIARALGDKLTTSLGQPVVVDNKPGASTNLGTDFVAKSAPDGYTLLIVASSHATSQFLFKKLPFDPIKDFVPIAYTHLVPLVMVVHPSVGAKTVPELLSWVKANPQKAIYASTGTGTAPHLAAELFMSVAGVKFLQVPYKGSVAAHPDLIAGRTTIMVDTVPAIRGHIQSGAVRAIAVTTLNRAATLRDLPAVSESPGFSGFDVSTWGGILAPAGTPRDVVLKLNGAINTALNLPDVRSRLGEAGIEIQSGTPEQFAAVIKTEYEKWGRIIRDAGIQSLD